MLRLPCNIHMHAQLGSNSFNCLVSTTHAKRPIKTFSSVGVDAAPLEACCNSIPEKNLLGNIFRVSCQGKSFGPADKIFIQKFTGIPWIKVMEIVNQMFKAMAFRPLPPSCVAF